MVAASGLAKVYLATGIARDEVMRARIEAHRQARSGHGWRSVETPLDPAPALAELENEEVALLDGVTEWLENILEDGRDWEAELAALIETAVLTPGPVVAVSREIGASAPSTPAGAEAWFQSVNGQMNRRIAEAAGQVVLVTAGIAQVLKQDEA